jgi:hypothetical protein
VEETAAALDVVPNVVHEQDSTRVLRSLI